MQRALILAQRRLPNFPQSRHRVLVFPPVEWSGRQAPARAVWLVALRRPTGLIRPGRFARDGCLQLATPYCGVPVHRLGSVFRWTMTEGGCSTSSCTAALQQLQKHCELAHCRPGKRRTLMGRRGDDEICSSRVVQSIGCLSWLGARTVRMVRVKWCRSRRRFAQPHAPLLSPILGHPHERMHTRRRRSMDDTEWTPTSHCR